ncbi:ribitol-5-phosphate 2-dehydrogenase [Peptostreptococcaceae bacterium pGA-8]|nr:ribitol-5-phosphate 2-dehydrogenase [Peptostreptococcaceae bacterium pGA-8]
MLNTVYRLTEPRKIEIEFSDVDLNNGTILVRPTHLSICNADQRYYQGKRSAEVLAKKLPMALIHEGIGTVVYSNDSELKVGQRVIMIPNAPVEEDEFIHENYLRSSRFRASGFDGFMQDCVALPKDRLVAVPEDIDPLVAAFSEIISVGYHAVNRFLQFSHDRRKTIGIWGDGNLAFLVALILRYRLPEAKIVVLGKNQYKLEYFSFVDETYLITDIPVTFQPDHAFECVGGEGSPVAINQIIDVIKPEATISILGVSENNVPINTRMILEKGLVVFGSSRSGRKDFLDTVRLFTEHPEVVDYFTSIVGQVVDVRNIEDMNQAFELDIKKAYGKTIMLWNV